MLNISYLLFCSWIGTIHSLVLLLGILQSELSHQEWTRHALTGVIMQIDNQLILHFSKIILGAFVSIYKGCLTTKLKIQVNSK